MKKPLMTIPDEFPITPEMRAWAASTVPLLDIDWEHQNFLDYWQNRNRRMKDWTRTWQTWMRRTYTFGNFRRRTVYDQQHY